MAGRAVLGGAFHGREGGRAVSGSVPALSPPAQRVGRNLGQAEYGLGIAALLDEVLAG